MYAGLPGRITCLILYFVLCACSAAPADLPTVARIAQVTPQPTTILAAAIRPTTGSASSIPIDLGPAERWIEVSVQEQMVRLHTGDRTIAEYPAATGVNTQPETTTYRGVFEVSRKYKGPIETAPGVYVMDILEFDLVHGNGIHSLPMDAKGHVLDDRVGTPVTSGCVRVAESTAVYDFATLRTKVWVH